MKEKDFDNYFGGCPECGGTNGCRSIGPVHWYYCDDHKTKWCVGENLFSTWKHLSEADWARNRAHLADYTVVQSLRTDLRDGREIIAEAARETGRLLTSLGPKAGEMPELEETGKQHPDDLPLRMAARKGVIDLIDIVNAQNPDFPKWMCLRTVADLLTEQVHHLLREEREAIDRQITEPDEQIPF
jgi:hypothetical protein